MLILDPQESWSLQNDKPGFDETAVASMSYDTDELVPRMNEGRQK